MPGPGGRLSDYCSKYDGSNPTLFASWLEDFENGTNILKLKSDRHGVVLSCLSGSPKDVAKAAIKEFEAGDATKKAALESSDATVRDPIASELWDQIKTTLLDHPSVVGTKPTDGLIDRWGKLTQGDDESVRDYYNRYSKIKTALADAKEIYSERVNYNHFVGGTQTTGLLPPIQYHVKLHGNKTVEEALKLAEDFVARQSASVEESKCPSGPERPAPRGPA